MKIVKLAITILSIVLITACSDSTEDIQVSGKDTEDTEDATTKKHESVELPVKTFSKENYYPGEDITFIRSIESVNVSDFTEDTVIEIEDRYNHLREMNLDLINEYKLVSLSMTHEVEGDTTKSPLEAFILDKNSEIHFNAEPIADNVVIQQVKQSTVDYRMGKTHDDKGEVLFAIPRGYFEGNLQLKTTVRNNGNNEVIYIDLQ